MTCPAWITLWFLSQSDSLQHLLHHSPVIGGFLLSFLHTFGTDPGRLQLPNPSGTCERLGPDGTLVQTHPRKNAGFLRRAAIGQPALLPALIGCQAASPAPSAPRFQPPCDKCGIWREMSLLSARGNCETLSCEPAVAEEPSTTASKPAPPHRLHRYRTTARAAMRS